MKKVVVSCGPIPAKLDSVKFITNKFKGGLALRTAQMLSVDFDVQLVKWAGTHLDLRGDPLPAPTDVQDVYDYYETIKSTQADAYILSAAVANLAPTNPWPGKFPSHNYKEGDKFNIEFTIAPRIIDRVKEWHPKSTLIGYKLFDGTEEELVGAAWETLVSSRANVIFANHPKTAKQFKIAVMPDGTTKRMTFDEHVAFIKRVINLEWYHTKVVSANQRHVERGENEALMFLSDALDRIVVKKGGMSFGTVAAKLGDKIFTTTRGKREGGFCSVYQVSHTGRTVRADAKATLNAPVLSSLFNKNDQIKYILHGHRQLSGVLTYPYSFSGTTEETLLIEDVGELIFNVENHGYYACFRNQTDVLRWLDDVYGC